MNEKKKIHRSKNCQKTNKIDISYNNFSHLKINKTFNGWETTFASI